MINEPIRQPEREIPLWIWATLLSGILALLIFISLNISANESAIGWRVEQMRAAYRDRFFRDSDVLPSVAADGGAQPAVAAATVPNDFDSLIDYDNSLLASVAKPTDTPAPTATALPTDVPTPTPSPTPTPITFDLVDPPPTMQLEGVRHEYQTPNNCGPSTLAMNLSYYGWEGTQEDVAEILKPELRDKNVRWDELVYYVKTRAGWLDALFRVGGDFETIELFVANGYPVIIETGYYVNGGSLWVGHYLLITGYDQDAQTFIVQDATGGPNRIMSYDDVDELWQQFNRLFILVFPAGDLTKIEYMLGDDADEDVNRENALAQSKAETESDPENAFVWANYGSNLNYFDRFKEAAEAYDTAREIGLPWRMLFYQFGAYRAYFYTGRYQDVEDLASATLNARPDLEESFLWRGWARVMLGDTTSAIEDFEAALEVNKNFTDAISALEYLGQR